MWKQNKTFVESFPELKEILEDIKKSVWLSTKYHPQS